MARYTFTVPSDSSKVTAELADDNAAWAEAVRFCGEMLRDIDGDLPSNTSWHIEVKQAQRFVASLRVLAQRSPP